MYRYSVDNAVTYTSEDVVLFRESPFACWMERLTLENPDHGIPPDMGSLPPGDSTEPQDDMADTLRSEGKDVRLIDWDAQEPERRRATLEAMRKGADFIVNGQLALGPLSGAANLLVRTSGYSELGDFLYIPCDTQARSGSHAAFRLCFLADLLHSLQGQLPPQMLIIRGGDDLVPLATESHIYHYRAVKQRFMEAMRGFRKHRMPDPAESAHFGRWSDCAHEVLKQRLLSEDQVVEEITDDDYVEPMRRAVGAVVAAGAGAYDRDDATVQPPQADELATAGQPTGELAAASGGRSSVAPGFTLAEQARMLKPGTYKPGPGVFRFGRPRPSASATDQPAEPAVAANQPAPAQPESIQDRPRYNRRASDVALQNLEFIGSNQHLPLSGLDAAPVPGQATAAVPPDASTVQSAGAGRTAPAPSLRDPSRTPGRYGFTPSTTPEPALGKGAVWGISIGGGTFPGEEPQPQKSAEQVVPPAQSDPQLPPSHSGIDMDGTHFASPGPGLRTSDQLLSSDMAFAQENVGHGFGQAADSGRASPAKRPFSDGDFSDDTVLSGHFSSSLITSDDYDG